LLQRPALLNVSYKQSASDCRTARYVFYVPMWLIMYFSLMNPIQELKNRIDASDRKLWHKTIVLGRGDFLKQKGTADSQVYYVKSGSLRTFIEQGEGEQTVRFGYPDTFLLALTSFFNEQPSDFCIQAIRRSEVLVMHKTVFTEFIHSSPETRRLWDQLIGKLVCEQVERELDLLAFSPEERYRRTVERHPGLFQEIPGKYIASYLRMTPETLSRLKKS
jgi:CRP-like cAMP-binding protein